MTGEMVTAGHLGGYIAGGDPATTYHRLWHWLVEQQGVRSVIDVGCGDGVAVAAFETYGCEVWGVDGVPQPHLANFEQHDYTTGPLYFDRKDLVWSCEFVEHVEEQYVPNFLATFACADLVLMTHAEPGQGGWHHVNCQPASYWIGLMDGIGYDHDERFTALTRKWAGANEDPWNHYVRSGMAFRRRT